MPGLTASDLERLFRPAVDLGTLGLAVSGGPDSLALMLLARQWASSGKRPRVVVYSVDHGLRPEAAGEAAMVREVATRLGLAARVLRWTGDKPETGVQAAARKARYQLMADAMVADGAELLATGHHLGDQAETVLMRLAHGSGVEGLRGMDRLATVEGCRIFRPLLGIDPEDLGAVVDEAGLVPASDPSNRDRHYERARWRELRPALDELGLDMRRLGMFATRMADADALIAAETEKAWTVLVHVSADGAELPHAGLATLPRAVAVRLLGRVLRVVGDDRRAHGLGAVESLHERLLERTPLRPATLHGCVIASDGLTVSVRREGARRIASLLTAD
jgi:tRNA(Ile)-lysidine synthase